jgi:gamma-glutamyltranspeptidase/glutathione hydrolase
MRPLTATRTGALFSAVAVAVVATGRAARPATDPPLITHGGVVASASPVASQVGAAVLGKGGNAVDAAVATALALGVVEPQSSGIGGGGFALVYVAAEKKVYVYDFREIAPAALTPESFVDGGVLDPLRARIGGLSVGVPGEVAGLGRMLSRHGTLSWRRAVAPSIRLARDGFPVAWFEPVAIARLSKALPADPRFDRLRAFMTPGGHALVAGEPSARPALARTLSILAAKGPAAFYTGAIADDVVATAKAAGGVITAQDLAAYAVDEPASPLWGTWRGHRLATMPLPSSGGIAILEALGLIDASGIDLGKLGVGSSAALHVIAEVLRHAFADRARFLGDDDAAKLIAAKLLDPARLSKLAKKIDPDHVQPHDAYGDRELSAAPPAPPPTDHGTSHLCVVDGDGNAVALTTTINGYYGAGLITDGGVVLNDEIDDFRIARDQANQFHLVQSERNLVGGGKRPLSSMSPTLVFDGDRVVACVGGAGGPGIISGTFQVLLDLFVWDLDPSAAVSQPRIHDQWSPDELGVEAEIPADVIDGLTRRGHTIKVRPWTTAVQAIRILPDGTRQAASDPRHAAAPAAAPTSTSASTSAAPRAR